MQSVAKYLTPVGAFFSFIFWTGGCTGRSISSTGQTGFDINQFQKGNTVMIRLLAFGLAVSMLTVSASAQTATWSLAGMLEDELIPTLLQKSEYDFSDLRGEVLTKTEDGTIWASKYSPSGPQQPFKASIAEVQSQKSWSWSLTVPVGGDGVDVFNTMAGSFATVLDARFDGLGWNFSVWGGPDKPQHGVAWQECKDGDQSGRAVMVQRFPGEKNSRIRIDFINYFTKECPK